MKFKLQCIFLVHLVYIASGAILRVKVKPENHGRDRMKPFDGKPKVSLVSRVVPHGYKTPPFEYDNRFNIIFVPKFRVQKRIDLNTMKTELASKEFFLQPFKAFQKTNVEKPKNVTAQFTSLKKFNKRNNKKPFKKLHGSHNVFRNREYEKPWHNRYSQSEKRTKMNSEESLLQTKRNRQKKQLNYYKGLDAFLKAIQRLYTKETRHRRPRSDIKFGTNLDKLFENNPKNIQKVQVSEIVNDILEDVQKAENDVTKHQSQSVEIGMKPLLKSIEVFQNNKKQDDDTNRNKLLQALQSLESEELRQIDQISLIRNLENKPHNKDNSAVSKTLDSLLDEMQKPNQEQHHKNKPNVKKLLFKSFTTFNMNKEDFISKLQKGGVLRLLENTLNKPSQSEIVNEVNSDEPLWESIKGPIKEIQVTKDLSDILNEPQKTTVNIQSGAASSDELWKPQVPKEKQSIPSVNLKTLLKQLRHVENARHKSLLEKRTEENAAESRPSITVPNKKAKDLEILLKPLKSLKNDELNLKYDSDEIPPQPVKVFNLADTDSENTKQKPRQQKRESFILYPTNDKKFKIAVRNLADLLKVWKYIESKKYAIQPLLRERGTKNVELDIGRKKVLHPFNFPHYSIWNFWTYDKTLLQDGCPGEQVKVGNMCIWTPPHRK